VVLLLLLLFMDSAGDCSCYLLQLLQPAVRACLGKLLQEAAGADVLQQ
jgi:hypothetical protein